jgi:hypothetical protein
MTLALVSAAIVSACSSTPSEEKCGNDAGPGGSLIDTGAADRGNDAGPDGSLIHTGAADGPTSGVTVLATGLSVPKGIVVSGGALFVVTLADGTGTSVGGA